MYRTVTLAVSDEQESIAHGRDELGVRGPWMRRRPLRATTATSAGGRGEPAEFGRASIEHHDALAKQSDPGGVGRPGNAVREAEGRDLELMEQVAIAVPDAEPEIEFFRLEIHNPERGEPGAVGRPLQVDVHRRWPEALLAAGCYLKHAQRSAPTGTVSIRVGGGLDHRKVDAGAGNPGILIVPRGEQDEDHDDRGNRKSRCGPAVGDGAQGQGRDESTEPGEPFACLPDFDGFLTARDVEPGENLPDMKLRSVERDAELFGHLGVGVAASDEFEDIALAGGEAVDSTAAVVTGPSAHGIYGTGERPRKVLPYRDNSLALFAVAAVKVPGCARPRDPPAFEHCITRDEEPPVKAAVYYETGGPEVFRYEDVPDPECRPGGIVFEVKAISIEGGDVLHRAGGEMPSRPHIVGYQAAGIVREAGDRVTLFNPGDPVVATMPFGSHAGLASVPERAAYAIPAGMDLVQAACVPVAFGTAHDCLFEFGHLQAGETVLVQAGAGGVGLATIQLAKRAGATVIATASSDDKLERLKAFGMDHGINYREKRFPAEVLRITGGKGADLVVDSVGGKTLEGSIEAVAYRGRISWVGNAGRDTAPPVVSPIMQKNATLTGVYLGAEFAVNPGRTRAMIEQLLRDIHAGQLKVVVDRTFPLSDAASAHRYIESRQAFGRVVMVP